MALITGERLSWLFLLYVTVLLSAGFITICYTDDVSEIRMKRKRSMGSDKTRSVTSKLSDFEISPKLELQHDGLQCPLYCRCNKTAGTVYTYVNCSHSGLSEIPNQIPDATTHLLLNFNSISSVRNYSFDGLTNLWFLDLSFNNLTTKSSYSIYSFRHLTKLRVLHMEGNCNYKRQPICTYPDQALRMLTGLKELYMDGISNTIPGAGFTGLKNLEILEMNGLWRTYCDIGDLTTDWIKHFRQCPLKTLSLIDCNIKNVSQSLLSNFTNLQNLDLSRNNDLCSKKYNFQNLLTGVSNTKLKVLNLSWTCNYRFSVQADMVKPLVNTSLRTLKMDRAHIHDIDSNVVDVLPKSLQDLSFRDNKFDEVGFINVIYKMPNLEMLDISYQNRFHSTSQLGDRSKSLGQFLTDHTTSKLTQEVRKCFNIAYEDLNFKGCLQQINTSSLIIHLPIKLPPELRILKASNLKLDIPVPGVPFTPNNSLEYADVSSNMLNGLFGKVSGLHSLQFLNLSDNRLSFIGVNVFGDLKNLKTLLLNKNRIGNQIHSELFSNLTNLEVLDLSYNEISDLPKRLFLFGRNLKRLNLSHNVLVGNALSVQSLHSLEVLDLSWNKIKSLSFELMNELDSIDNNILNLNLSGNILDCSCENVRFVRWLAQSRVRFTGLNQGVCMYRNKSEVELRYIKVILDKLESECIAEYVVIGCVTAFGLSLLIGGCSLCLYNQRWKMKYLYYIGRRRVNPYHTLEGQDIVMEHEAYISYGDSFVFETGEDMHTFVTQYIYNALLEKGLRVKIREELQSGMPLYNTIPTAIRHANKVIVLLTDDYCKDTWNSFEFNMAALEGIYTKRNIIIPVIFGQFCSSSYSEEILAFLSASENVIIFPGKQSISEFLELLEQRIRN